MARGGPSISVGIDPQLPGYILAMYPTSATVTGLDSQGFRLSYYTYSFFATGFMLFLHLHSIILRLLSTIATVEHDDSEQRRFDWGSG